MDLVDPLRIRSVFTPTSTIYLLYKSSRSAARSPYKSKTKYFLHLISSPTHYPSMATEILNEEADHALVRKGRRKALKKINPNTAANNEANLLLPSHPSPLLSSSLGKENGEPLAVLPLSPSKEHNFGTKPKHKKQSTVAVDELLSLQHKLQQMQLEKEKTEGLLKERDEILKMKEEELEKRGVEHEKLQMELKKWQKLKEFKPTMTFPLVQSLREKELEKKQQKKKKNGSHETKRPCPPYSLWCKDQWNEVKKENPNADFKEISTILGSKWKNLIPEEKKPYEEKYQMEKESYLKIIGKERREKEAMKLLEEEQKQQSAMELLEQYLQFKQEADKEGKKTRKAKDPTRPKHPMSAFFLFSAERRAVLLAENKNILEIAKIAGEEWKNMAEEKRAPYEVIAKKQKEEYLLQMDVYHKKKEEEGVSLQREEEELMKVQKQEALQLLKKKEKTENIMKKRKEKKKKQKEGKNVDPNRPKKPATSFLLFSQEARKQLLQERPEINNSTLRALVSIKWKELGEEEKVVVWKKKAAEAMVAYKKKLEEYNKSAANAADSDPHSHCLVD